MTTTQAGPGRSGAAGAGDLAADLDALEQIVERLTTADGAVEMLEHAGPWLGEAAVRVHRATQRLMGKRLGWLLAEQADGRWATSGARTYATYVAHTHRISQSRAKAEVRLARQLRDEAARFDEALRRGDIGVEQAQILARVGLTSPDRVAGLRERVQSEAAGTGDDDGAGDGAGDGAEGDASPSDTPEGEQADPAEGADGHGADGREGDGRDGDTVEGFLLGQARRMRPEEFRRLVRHYACVADPDADDRGYRKAQEKEHLELSRTLDGYHLRGFLTEEHGQQVCTALDALMGAPGQGETRSASQRRAQALADMARVVLDQGLAGTSASVRPHLGVVIGAEEFARMMADAAAQDSAFGPAAGAGDDAAAGAGAGGERGRSKRGAAGAGDADEGGASDVPARATGTGSGNGRDRAHQDGHDDVRDGAHGAQEAAGGGAGDGHDEECDGGSGAGSAGAARSAPGSTAAFEPAPGDAADHSTGGYSEQTLAQIARWDWAALLGRPPAMWSDASGPVPAQVLRRLARCGDVYRVLFSPDNEVINHGRAHRVFTAAQRRAIVARDGHCTFPGCTAPPVLCETHHALVRWAQNGNTDIHNGALLCFHHHDLVEARGLIMTRTGGTWHFHRRDGTQIHTSRDAHRNGPQTPPTPWKRRE